jgi:hypothetical protein
MPNENPFENLPPDAPYVIRILTWAGLCAEYHEKAGQIEINSEETFIEMTEIQTKLSMALCGMSEAVKEAKDYLQARQN